MFPRVLELSPAPQIEQALQAFADWSDLLLLESAAPRPQLGRYSFLSAAPVLTHTLQRAEYRVDPFAVARQWSQSYRSETVPGLPPFQGGVAGLLGYELGGCFERLPQATWDEFQLPVAFFGLYDWVLAWDHLAGRAWLVAHGFSEPDPLRRAAAADRRLDELAAKLSNAARSEFVEPHAGQPSADLKFAPQFSLDVDSPITSNFSRDAYLKAVARVIDYIYAGDIFQANLSQRLLARWERSALDLYSVLRRKNPAPFAGLLRHDDWAIISASPERFVRVQGDVVETRPIKGTRKRRSTPEADLFTRDELRESEKDTAENVMIVDLLRNDLSRVCEPGSISVPQLCGVETYETVQHLVSEIRGHLSRESGADPWSLLAATFPGGSITGAPKVRAMQIIAEQEPTVRGPYCGSLFYVGSDGSMDSSILIRSFVLRHGWVQCCVGGGIVAQSDPANEYEETLVKAEGMLRVFRD